ncbi:hypothetical protein Trydic_g13085 [Trypoxylus dichotomus]
MLHQGTIKPSNSPWPSIFWLVPKKRDGSGERKSQIVIDYREVNEKSIGNAYRLPNIEDILDQLGYVQYFATLDLGSDFHQTSIDPKMLRKPHLQLLMGITNI